jgi:hypothetical protein
MGVPGGLLPIGRDVLVDDPFQTFFEVEPGPVEAAPDGPDRHSENRGDLFVTESVELLHHHDGPMVVGQGVQGGLDQLVTLSEFQRERRVARRGLVPGVDGIVIGSSQPERHLPATSTAQGQVHSDPVDPGIERAFSVKLVELLERFQERVLQEIERIFRAAGQPEHRGVKPVLIALDQNPKCFRPPRTTRLDKGVVDGVAKFPRTRNSPQDRDCDGISSE